MLDLVEGFEEGDGDENDDCFLAVANFKLHWMRISKKSFPEVMSSAEREGLVPHEQTRTAKASTRSSCPECSSRGRRSRSRCWFPGLRDAASMGWWPQSC